MMIIDDNLVLRAAHRSEASAIAGMSRLQIEHGLNWRWTSTRVRQKIDAPDTMVLVASMGCEIEGFAIMKFGDTDAHLFLLAVDPKARRRGIGRALVHWLEKSCEIAGLASIRLEVRAANLRAITFYEQLGYARSGEITDYYDGREAAVIMTHSLSQIHSA
jgi:ribosomal-protein-alanine N-acetyltransferase